MEDKSKETSINRGEEFMRLRGKRNKDPEQDENNIKTEGDEKMSIAAILVFSTLLIIGGTMLGFVIGWFSSAYYQSFMDTLQISEEPEETMQITPHPEMMDDQGNMIPFQMAKLISVEFEQRDAFDSDPFPED